MTAIETLLSERGCDCEYHRDDKPPDVELCMPCKAEAEWKALLADLVSERTTRKKAEEQWNEWRCRTADAHSEIADLRSDLAFEQENRLRAEEKIAGFEAEIERLVEVLFDRTEEAARLLEQRDRAKGCIRGDCGYTGDVPCADCEGRIALADNPPEKEI